MAGQGKRFRQFREMVEIGHTYAVEEGVRLAKETGGAKFDSTVELHLNLGIDPAHQDQQVRGTVALPHGTGKSVRVIAFASGDSATAAKEAGADEVGAEDLAKKVQSGWLGFDATVATPDMMRIVSPLGRILGPRGLMPNARAGTVTSDVAQAVQAIKAGQVEYRADQGGNIHFAIGKVSFTAEQLMANLLAALDAIIRARPDGAKGTYINSVTLSTTMGPGILVDLNEAVNMARTVA